MIQQDHFKAYYKQMTDSELYHFVQNESQHISHESHGAVLAEIKSRKFNNEIVDKLETDKALEEITEQLASEDSYTNTVKEQIWNFIINEKVEGKTDDQILDYMISQGFKKDHALLFLASVVTRSQQLTDNSDMDIFIGWVLFFIGFALLCTGFIETVKWEFVIHGIIVFISGVAKLSLGYAKQRKHQIVVNSSK